MFFIRNILNFCKAISLLILNEFKLGTKPAYHVLPLESFMSLGVMLEITSMNSNLQNSALKNKLSTPKSDVHSLGSMCQLLPESLLGAVVSGSKKLPYVSSTKCFTGVGNRISGLLWNNFQSNGVLVLGNHFKKGITQVGQCRYISTQGNKLNKDPRYLARLNSWRSKIGTSSDGLKVTGLFDALCDPHFFG